MNTFTVFLVLFLSFLTFSKTAYCQIILDEKLPEYLKLDNLHTEDDIFWSEDFITPIWQNPDVTAVAAIQNNIFTAENGKIITYKFNTNTWNLIGSIGSGIIYTMTNHDSLIFVGGSFEMIEGKRVNFVSKWDGNQWSALDKGLDNRVYTLAVDGDGVVYAGGEFNSSRNNDKLNYFAFWDGDKWDAPVDQPNGFVRAIFIKGDSVIIGGDFEMIGDIEFLKIAVWDKKRNKWFQLGNGIQSGQSEKVLTICSDNNGNVFAGGIFNSASESDVSNLAMFDGKNWSDINGGIKGIVKTLAFKDNHLYVGGYFSKAGNKNINYIAYWDGKDWFSLKDGVQGGEAPSVTIIYRTPDNHLLVGGSFNTAGEISCNGLALWNGSDWVSLFNGKRNGVISIVYDMAIDVNNFLYVGGAFVKTGDKPSRGLSMWDGINWVGCNKGLDPPAVVYSIKTLGSDVFFTGWYFGADSSKLNNVAKWIGKEQRWEPIGPGIDGGDGVLGPILISGEEIFVGGRFKEAGDITVNHITYWDGTKWNNMEGGISNQSASISTIVEAGNGQIYITGSFDTVAAVPTKYFAVWDKNLKKWVEPPLRFNGVPSVILIDGDSVYFGGSFSNVSGVDARNLVLWDRKSDVLYSFPPIDGSVRSIIKWFDDIYVGGFFVKAGEKTVNSVFKYNLKTGEIEALGSGVKQGSSSGRIYKMIIHKNALYVGGMFTNAGNKLSSNFAMWSKIKADKKDDSAIRNNIPGFITKDGLVILEFNEGNSLNNVEIFNNLGQLVKKFNNNDLEWDGNKLKINFEEIGKGFFLLRLSYNNHQESTKVIHY